MKQKQTFKLLLAYFSVIMILLPFFAALNSFLTNLLNTAGWYRPIQNYIVPGQARMVAAAVAPFGIKSYVTPLSQVSAFFMVKNQTAIPVDLSWNCLGWQSVLLLIVSLVAGLRGKFTLVSRAKCVIFGLLGTLLVNILRMSVIAVGIYYVNSVAAKVVHDYFAAFFTIIWLLFFWIFSYKYILEDK